MGGYWVPRGDVLRCIVHDGGPEGEASIEIDDHEYTLQEFGKMLTTHAGWGMRICFVPDDRIGEEPKIRVDEQEDRETNGLPGPSQLPQGTVVEAKVSVCLTAEEMGDIRDHTFIDESVLNSGAVRPGVTTVVQLSPDNIEEIQGYLAAEANHTRSKKLQKRLDALYDKLQQYLDRLNGGDTL